jgi:thiazole synthase ThiGH ThiG subunit
MKMLERRRIYSTLYLGTGKNEKGELIAHAWLRSGSEIVTGGEEMKEFTVVGSFSKIIHAVGDNDGS